MEFIEKYKKYCRPKVAELLQKTRLDKVYHRSKADYMYYYDECGNEIQIIDFLGGYGASLFGHNNEEIVNTAINNYAAQIPFNAQASCRSNAALLAEKLNHMMKQRTGKEYVITFANSGTEAVEAAIKHSEMFVQEKLKDIIANNHSHIYKIRKACKEKPITFVIEENIKKKLFNDGASQEKICLHLEEIQKYNRDLFMKTPVFIALEKAFHGKTTGSVKLSYNKSYRAPFERIGIHSCFLSQQDLNNKMVDEIIERFMITYIDVSFEGKNVFIREKRIPNISGIIVEPLQGEGGIHIIRTRFLEKLRKITRLHQIPLIFDEIQCGMGRTGTFLFSEQAKIYADYYLLSKSLGGGIAKISALIIQSDLYLEEFGYIHTSTFAEDEHSCSIALKALDIIDRDDTIYKKCRETGEFIINGVNLIKSKYPGIIKEVRGCGLMLGIEFANLETTNAMTLRIMQEQKLFGYIISGYFLHEHRIRVAPALSDSATIRIEPSAYISRNNCELLLKALDRLCNILMKENIYELLKFVIKKETYDSTSEIIDCRNSEIVFTADESITSVGFLGHIIEAKHLKLFDCGYCQFTDDEAEELIDTIYPMLEPSIISKHIISSQTGEKINFMLITLFLTSKIITHHMKNKDFALITEKIEQAIQIGKENKCEIIGFGGYTSIVTNNCKNIKDDSLSLTSGNSLTVAVGVEAIIKKARELNIPLEKSTFAAIGANGNIASTYCEIISEYVPNIILIGREGRLSRLNKVKEDIYRNALNSIYNYYVDKNANLSGISNTIFETHTLQKVLLENPLYLRTSCIDLIESIEAELGDQSPIFITDDLSYLRNADLILSASNSSETLIFPEMLGDQEIVICDIAVPPDTDESVTQKSKNVHVIKGGILELPVNRNFQIRGVPLDKGEAFACMSETMCLGLSGINQNYSYGKIDIKKVKEIFEISKAHGFKLTRMKTERSY